MYIIHMDHDPPKWKEDGTREKEANSLYPVIKKTSGGTCGQSWDH